MITNRHWQIALALALCVVPGRTETSAQGHPAAIERTSLASGGAAKSVIVIPEKSLTWEGDSRNFTYAQRFHPEFLKEQAQRVQRDAIKDLSHYLSKISGAEIEIVETLPNNDPRTPIYIGTAAETVFGPVGVSKAGRYGFRVVVDDKGIGLYGESEYGTSYAIYELLHRLGCRWYMPSELGEVIPSQPELKIPEMDEKLAPATEWRRMQGRTADADFVRRNRSSNSDYIATGHQLESYISAEQLEANPEWRIQDADGNLLGRPHSFRWTREDTAQAVAERIIEMLDDTYQVSMSLAPQDYVIPTEDPEESKHDPEPRVWEPAAGRWSVTDRLIMLCNRVAERVGEKYPEVTFGVLAYVNYNMPPARERVHQNVIPRIAPIDFNRHHPMNWPDHPNEFWLKDIVEGWGEKAERLAYYAYGMNLAEITAPNPFITKWGTDIPIILENNVAYWVPETMSGWECMLPGFYLSLRMTFNAEENAEDILEELWTEFYGAAAEPMKQYWLHMDRAWVETREYSGSFLGYLRMFTPAVMTTARELVDEALKKCETISEYRRVDMVNQSLSLFELFMTMREDFAAGRLRHLERDLDHWVGSYTHLRERYKDQYGFGQRTPQLTYINVLIRPVYVSAARMEREYARHGAPLYTWKWKHNPGPEEASLPWTAPDYDDADWPVTHVVRETWSTIGHHNSMTDDASGRSGRMVYRANQRLSELTDGKRAQLWIGGVDSSAKLFVNGKHVPYVVPEDTRRHKEGDVLDRFHGYARAAAFDVTDALRTGDNQYTILAERTWLNELGSGGLIGPVVIYRDR